MTTVINPQTGQERLLVLETYEDDSAGHIYGEGTPYEPFTDDTGQLFAALRSEYGRPGSSVYVDRNEPDAPPKRVGWTFIKRVDYDDAHRLPPDEQTYLRRVWVSLLYITPNETITYYDLDGKEHPL